MDHRANNNGNNAFVLNADLNSAHAIFVGNCIKTRARPINPMHNVDTFELQHNGLVISGFLAACGYILERYPEPEILPGDPVRRAIQRSIVDKTLFRNCPPQDLIGLIDKRSRFLVQPQTPTFIDIAVVSTTEPNDEQWGWLHCLFENFLNTRATEAMCYG